jgi:hypothetical protein
MMRQQQAADVSAVCQSVARLDRSADSFESDHGVGVVALALAVLDALVVALVVGLASSNRMSARRSSGLATPPAT